MAFPDRPGVNVDVQFQPSAPAVAGLDRTVAYVGTGRNYKTTQNEEVVRGTRVTGETLTVVTDLYGQTATLANAPVLSGSERLILNDTSLLERDVDYTIDYVSGVVTFLTPIGGTDVVKASYSHGSTDTLSVVDEFIKNGGVGTLTGRVERIGDEAGNTDYVEGTDYSWAIDANGVITVTWLGAGTSPAGNSTYYVTYKVFKYGADYYPRRYYDLEDVLAYEGPVLELQDDGSYAIENTLSLAAYIAFNSGAPSVYLSPVEGEDNDLHREEAIDKLERYSQVNWVVPLTTSAAVHAHAKQHVLKMSTNQYFNLRRACLGGPVGTIIGDIDTPDSLVYRAHSLNDRRVVYMAPPRGVLDLEDGAGNVSEYIVDGSFVGAGAVCIELRTDSATPWTRKNLLVFKRLLDEGEDYTGAELQTLRAGGLCAIERALDENIVSHGLATDVSSVNTREITVTGELDVAALTYKAALDGVVIGSKLTDSTVRLVSGIVRAASEVLIDPENERTNMLRAVGQINVKESETQPDTILVTIPVQPIYATNFIDITIPVQTQL